MLQTLQNKNGNSKLMTHLKTAALIAKQKQQRYDDSIKIAKKRQQQIDDSLQTIAIIKKQRQKQIDDSLALQTSKRHRMMPNALRSKNNCVMMIQ